MDGHKGPAARIHVPLRDRSFRSDLIGAARPSMLTLCLTEQDEPLPHGPEHGRNSF